MKRFTVVLFLTTGLIFSTVLFGLLGSAVPVAVEPDISIHVKPVDENPRPGVVIALYKTDRS